MKLYFLRHAEAVQAVDDWARPLSAKGEQDTRVMGTFLQRAGLGFDAAFTSPLIRAKQTAEILLRTMGATVALQEAAELANDATQPAFETWLLGVIRHRHALLVGHAPSLPTRIRQLLGMRDPEALKMPKGGMICVSTEDGARGILKFFISPRLLGNLAP